ncbi:MAG TPA: hypothetical protein PLM86_02195 [Bacteroidales bacterium]|nr:MAG: hypothetical protein BWX93_00430 [Bacteroidetes bacterium ADurb.Bin139]HOG24980.1 hypothetical protein [Bacteroidales bacterium]HOR11007.1 hypothetical protein [Bacteroidales bacterium]HOZ19132.1 hypothetical protein [Bacteroidales bacterium]HPK38478.1 hypothetical protein [Bacteroidales bacterium]
MRKLPDIFFCLLIGVSFLTSTAGFSVHHCLHEDSRHVWLISADPSCGAIHARVGRCNGEYCDGVHDRNCCRTEVFFLDDPILASHGTDARELIQKLADQDFVPVHAIGSGHGTTGIPAVSLLHFLPVKHAVYPGNHLVPLRL